MVAIERSDVPDFTGIPEADDVFITFENGREDRKGVGKLYLQSLPRASRGKPDAEPATYAQITYPSELPLAGALPAQDHLIGWMRDPRVQMSRSIIVTPDATLATRFQLPPSLPARITADDRGPFYVNIALPKEADEPRAQEIFRARLELPKEAARTDFEQRFRRRIRVAHGEALGEQDDRGGEKLEPGIGAGHGNTGAPQRYRLESSRLNASTFLVCTSTVSR